MGWFAYLTPSVVMPYLVVVGLTAIGIMCVCLWFCIDLRNGGGDDYKLNWKKSLDTVDTGGRRGQEMDIEMETFSASKPFQSEAGGPSREAPIIEEDERKTPRVLRGLTSPRRLIGEGRWSGRGRMSFKDKILSGSRGGQSSWSYVNLAYEKDVDLILSPETLKRRKAERIEKREKMKAAKDDHDSKEDAKDVEGAKKPRRRDIVDYIRKPLGAQYEVEGDENATRVEMKTFGSRQDQKVLAEEDTRSDITGSKSEEKRLTRWTSTTSNSWPMSKEEEGRKMNYEAWERENILRSYENLDTLDVAQVKQGFRLKHLKEEWEEASYRKKEMKGSDGGEENKEESTGSANCKNNKGLVVKGERGGEGEAMVGSNKNGTNTIEKEEIEGSRTNKGNRDLGTTEIGERETGGGKGDDKGGVGWDDNGVTGRGKESSRDEQDKDKRDANNTTTTTSFSQSHSSLFQTTSFSSQTSSASTKLLIPPDNDDDNDEWVEEEAFERGGRIRSSTFISPTSSSMLMMGYSSTLPKASEVEGVSEGEITFYADGKKREFKVYSAS